jgi:hypothetical protein
MLAAAIHHKHTADHPTQHASSYRLTKTNKVQSHLPVQGCHALQQGAQAARIACHPFRWRELRWQAAMKQLVDGEALKKQQTAVV